jgi:uncharacterized delta-60 repeat protein
VAPVDPQGVAIDAPDLSISNDVYNPWAPDVSGTNDYDGLCAAQSYSIGDYDSSSFAVTNLMGPTNVSFWCRIDADDNTYLDMIVDGDVSNTISGQTTWQQYSYQLPAGAHTLTWTFRKDNAISVGMDAAWVDQLVLSGSNAPPPSGGLSYTTGGSASWYLESTNVHSPPDAWQSGPMSGTGSSWLQTSVTGPGTLSFWESASGNPASLLGYVVDGVSGNDLLGTAPWTQVTVPLGGGAHTITWTYYENVSGANDTGWVGDIVFTPNSGPPPSITSQPTNVMVKAGNPAELDVLASGTAPLSYQWYSNTVPLLNATNTSLSFASAVDADAATYYVIVTNLGGSIQSSNATLTVVDPPTLNWGPYYDSVDAGDWAYFGVSMSGTEPLAYQWYKSNAALPNATNSYLYWQASTNDAGWYYVIVTNWAGSWQSPQVRLTVDLPLRITSQSTNQTVYIGEPFVLHVDASGTAPLTYKWMYGSTVLSSGYYPYYVCPNAQLTNAGAYTATVTDSAGYSATTSPAMNVTVQPVPPTASPGTVDHSFNFGLSGWNVAQVVALSSGQMILGGSFSSFDGIERNGLARLNADGSLDLYWDPNLNIGANVNSMVFQPDGRFIIAGSFTSVNGVGRTNIARLNADGSLDPTFNPGAGPNASITLMAGTPDGGVMISGGAITSFAGVARTNLVKLTSTGAVDPSFNAGVGPQNNDEILSLACQGGGYLLGGYIRTFSYHACGSILRLNPDGSYDTSFTPTAITRSGFHGDIMSIAVQPDGRILLAGLFDPVGTGTNSGLVRLTTNGLYDATFNPPIGTSAYENYGGNFLKLMGNGQILFACRYLFGNPNTTVVRMNTDGSIDNSFATNGAAFAPDVFSLDVTTDGHVLAAGTFAQVNNRVMRGVVNLNTDGTLNTAFRPGFGTSGAVRAIAVQPDGKIVIGGDFTNVDYASGNGVARIQSDGSLDTSFNAGLGATNLSYWPVVQTLALYSNGCVLVGGTFSNFNGLSAPYIVRLLTNGAVDSSFASPFNTTDRGGNGSDATGVNTIVVQPDGRILIGGNFWSVGGVRAEGIARLLPSGSLDTTMQTTNAPGEIEAIKLLPNGQIYVGGYYLLLARLNSDGTRDTSFAPNVYNIGGSVYAMELQPDGCVIIGNNSSLYEGSCLVRFNPDGTPDGGFYSGYGSATTVSALLLQPDGRLLVGGPFSYFNNQSRTRLARVNADGSLDPLFTPAPILPGSSGQIYCFAALPDGRILAGGSYVMMSDRSISPALGRDNLAALNTENPVVGALPVGPTILSGPQGGSVNIGGAMTMNVSAIGTPPLGYQWYRNSQLITGAVGSSLALNPIFATNAGSYFVMVSNVVTSVPSSPATVFVYPPFTVNSVGQTLTLNWNGIPGHTYEVLRSTSGNLARPGIPPWTVVDQFIANSANCAWTSASLTSQTNSFFRILDVTSP